MLPIIPSTAPLFVDLSQSVHDRPRPTSLLPAGPLLRRAGAVRAHIDHHKSWTPTSINPPALHLNIPTATKVPAQRPAPESVEMDDTTPLARRHSGPPTASPWTEDRGGLIDLWGDDMYDGSNDSEGFKEAVVSSSVYELAPLRPSRSLDCPIMVATTSQDEHHPAPVRQLITAERSSIATTKIPLSHHSAQSPPPCKCSPPPRQIALHRVAGEASRTPRSLRVNTPAVAQSALASILDTPSGSSSSSSSSSSSTPSSSSFCPTPLTRNSSPCISTISPPSPRPSQMQQQQYQYQYPNQVRHSQPPTSDPFSNNSKNNKHNHRSIIHPLSKHHKSSSTSSISSISSPSNNKTPYKSTRTLITPPTHNDDINNPPPAVVQELRTRLDEALRSWGEGTSPVTPAGVRGGGGFMAREERALSWHPGLSSSLSEEDDGMR